MLQHPKHPLNPPLLCVRPQCIVPEVVLLCYLYLYCSDGIYDCLMPCFCCILYPLPSYHHLYGKTILSTGVSNQPTTHCFGRDDSISQVSLLFSYMLWSYCYPGYTAGMGGWSKLKQQDRRVLSWTSNLKPFGYQAHWLILYHLTGLSLKVRPFRLGFAKIRYFLNC